MLTGWAQGSYDGCNDCINSVYVNAMDIFGNHLNATPANHTLIFVHNSSLNVNNTYNVVYNISRLDDKLILVEYKTNVTNKGNIIINKVKVEDKLSGTHDLDSLIPEQTKTVAFEICYEVKQEAVNSWANDTFNTTGLDRCGKIAGPKYTHLNFSIDTEKLCNILKAYSLALNNRAIELNRPDLSPEDLEIFGQSLNYQSNRLILMHNSIVELWKRLPE